MEGWQDERWLDISHYAQFAKIMQARLDLAKQKGCDAVEPDNIDWFDNDTGFDITADDQLLYNKWLADQAHKRGLAIALKNDVSQVSELLPYFDFAVNEECFSYDECNLLVPFVHAGKAVFGVEYDLDKDGFCTRANKLGFSFAKAETDLAGSWQSCKK
jgi:hypothetical protein